MMTFLIASLFVLYAVSRPSAFKILLYLPSTAMHEIAHWIIALVTGRAKGLPSIWPKKIEEGWQLGHVVFEEKFFSAGLIALAPVYLLLPVAWWHLTSPSENWIQTSYYSLIGGYALIGAVPSSTDLQIALKNPVGSLVAVCFLYLEFDYARSWLISYF